MINFDDYDVLSFDCYGTLIDWERGIVTALKPVFAAHSISIDRRKALELFGELESTIESGEFVEYRIVLQHVLDGLGTLLGFTPSAGEREAFANSVRDWPPFSDSSRALKALHTKYKLAVISNVDDDLFAHSTRRLDVAFDWIITAQQVRSYKPSLKNFEHAFERIGVPRVRQLHVAQSLFHDIAPAKSLGLATVWVNRRSGKDGSGATPAARAEPDLEVPDLETLARHARLL
ncbi:MAG: haloacid dehalogenase type II [Gemmatimonadaceae bacterium]